MKEDLRRELKGLVEEAYKNAEEGGYGEFVKTNLPSVVALDMAQFDSEIERFLDGHDIGLGDLKDIVEEVQMERSPDGQAWRHKNKPH